MRRTEEREGEERRTPHSFVFSFFLLREICNGEGRILFLFFCIVRLSFYKKQKKKPFPFSSCVFLFFCISSSFAEIRWRKRRKKREIHAIYLLGENEREKEEERKGVMPYGEDIRERETKDTQELDGDA